MPRTNMPRTNTPRTGLATHLHAGIVVLALSLAGCGTLGGPGHTPTPTAKPRPSLQMTVTGGPATGTYASDAAATLNLCTANADGGWRAMYAGGDPWLNVDLSVGSHIAEPGHEADAALEISAGSGYLWIDQAGFRGGDPKGRSTISVAVARGPGATTLVVNATSPNRTSGEDGPLSDVELTWTCPT